MLPAGSLPGWSTKYYEVFLSDCTLYRSFATKDFIGDASIVIFKDSENIEACLDIDILIVFDYRDCPPL